MAVYKVEICGVNTSKLPLLKNEEKERLFRRIQEGDPEAREEYIKGNLRLVLSVIQRFAGNGDNMDDLFQIGCIGLIKAIDNFDVSQNVKFSTYAVPMNRGEGKTAGRDGKGEGKTVSQNGKGKRGRPPRQAGMPGTAAFGALSGEGRLGAGSLQAGYSRSRSSPER